ncbi:MAG: hypothetical protein P4M09_09640 [Devosia sp.]|nr:hypothetical protein [Devosia sp.]
MRKFSLYLGSLALIVGLGGVSTASSAFAMGCLNPDAGTLDLTHDAMKPGAGWGYDKEAVDKVLSQGNRCSVTQQSQPVSDNQLNTYRSTDSKNSSSYN